MEGLLMSKKAAIVAAVSVVAAVGITAGVAYAIHRAKMKALEASSGETPATPATPATPKRPILDAGKVRNVMVNMRPALLLPGGYVRTQSGQVHSPQSEQPAPPLTDNTPSGGQVLTSAETSDAPSGTPVGARLPSRYNLL